LRKITRPVSGGGREGRGLTGAYPPKTLNLK